MISDNFINICRLDWEELGRQHCVMLWSLESQLLISNPLMGSTFTVGDWKNKDNM
jgi:hypothetical protein